MFWSRTAIGACLLAGLVIVSCEDPAMAFGKHVLFSSVQGTVLNGGVPVAGAEIVREFNWIYTGEKGSDGTTTASDGSFELPPIERSSIGASVVPHEGLVGQKILIRHGGTEYRAWVNTKRNYDANGELDGRPIRLRCELTAESTAKGDILGICEIL
jgi:hypothetical protein